MPHIYLTVVPKVWTKTVTPDGDKFERGNFPSSYDTGINNNCGAFQLCVDMGNPNGGFTHFDNMAASMLAIFQVSLHIPITVAALLLIKRIPQAFSADSQYNVMWTRLAWKP